MCGITSNAHPSMGVFNKLVQTLLKYEKFTSHVVCFSCTISKSHRLPFAHKHTPCDTPFALLDVNL